MIAPLHNRSDTPHALLSRERERELAALVTDTRASERERTAAIHELVLCNLPFVYWMVARYVYHADYDDALMDGQVGLIRAAQRIDPERLSSSGARFATFAAVLIRNEVFRGLQRRHRKLVHIPPNVLLDASRMEAAERPDAPAADPALDPGRRARAMLVKRIHVLSVHDPETSADTIADDRTVPPHLTLERRELLLLIVRAMDELDLSPADRELVLSTRGDHDAGDGVIIRLARERRVGKSRIRMLKKELLWRVRRCIQQRLGRHEYRAIGGPPLARHWRETLEAACE